MARRKHLTPDMTASKRPTSSGQLPAEANALIGLFLPIAFLACVIGALIQGVVA